MLDELGMPWVAGYKPKRNYQNVIFDRIDRYLSAHESVRARIGKVCESGLLLHKTHGRPTVWLAPAQSGGPPLDEGVMRARSH